MIRTERRVPFVYPQESLDFLLLCRLIDLIFNGVKFNVNEGKYTGNPRNCPEDYLDLVADKLGFEYSTTIYKNQLRIILYSFLRLKQYKGSLKGIRGSVNTFLYLMNKSCKYNILYKTDNKLYIQFYSQVFNIDILREILKYILPCGLEVVYQFIVTGQEVRYAPRVSQTNEIVIISITNNKTMSTKVYKNDTSTLVTPDYGYLVDSVGTEFIASSSDITNAGTKFEEKERDE